jgi:AcrR family transcriptional regulator
MPSSRLAATGAPLDLTPSGPESDESPITAAAIAARRRRGKKTQSERSTDMRGRLLEATLECLAKHGYAGTSFSTIAQQAGVSRGALQHHYPEKNYVIAGALEILSKRLLEDFLPEAIEMPRGTDRIAFVLDHIWLATLSGAITAITDIRMAARSDLQLRSMLLPLEHRARKRQYQLVADACGGALGTTPGFAQRVEAVLATVRGLGIQLAYGWDRGEVEAAWAIARDDFVVGFQQAEKMTASSPAIVSLEQGEHDAPDRRGRRRPAT